MYGVALMAAHKFVESVEPAGLPQRGIAKELSIQLAYLTSVGLVPGPRWAVSQDPSSASGTPIATS